MTRVHSAEEFGKADSEAGRPGDKSREVRAAQRGDEAAFRALFRQVQPGLLRYLTVLVGEEAEDVASETWLQVTRDLATFNGDFDGFRGWVTTIGRNRALDLLRRRRRRPVADLPVEYLLDRRAPEDTESAALATVAADDALELIARLPRDQGEAVLLRVVMDLDAASAARVLGKRPGAVRTAAHRGLRKLAQFLEQRQTNPGGAQRPPERSYAPEVTPTTSPTLKDAR